MKTIKPTPARLRAMSWAAEPNGWAWSQNVDDHSFVRLCIADGLMYWDGVALRYRATDAGRAWLAEHDAASPAGEKGPVKP